MGSERQLWRYVRKGMCDRWFAQRIETRAASGVPDVWYVLQPDAGRGVYHYHQGWLELKHLRELPKRASTPVRLPDFTEAQRRWLGDVGADWAGETSMLLQVDRHYLLLPWWHLDEVGRVPIATLMDYAIGAWYRRIDFNQLAESLASLRWHGDSPI